MLIPRQSFALIAAVVAAGVVLWSRTLDPCDTTISRKIPSPDGQRTAILYHRGCGATVPFNTEVAVVAMSGRFSPRDDAVLAIKELYDLSLHWRGNDALEVVLPRDAMIYRKNSAANGIAILYR